LDEAVRLHDLAVSLQAEGKLREAVPLCRQALALVERAVGPHVPDVTNLLNTLAGIHADLGEYAEAERLAQRSVATIEPVTGEVEVEVLRVQSLGTLAGIHRGQGRYAEAEPLYQRALGFAEAALGPQHLEVATCLNNLAVLYKYTAQFGKAARLYRRALAIVRRALGPDHPEVAAIYHNLAPWPSASRP
jgi:tetratricopeptide (TPR) repeat protein